MDVSKSSVTEIVERYHTLITTVRNALAAEQNDVTAENAILLYMFGTEPIRVSYVMQLWPHSVTYRLRELESIGMISRSEYKLDKRGTLVSVTARGKAVQRIIADMEKVL